MENKIPVGRFTHVIAYAKDSTGTGISEKSLLRVPLSCSARSNFELVPIDEFPQYSKYAFKGYLLIYKCSLSEFNEFEKLTDDFSKTPSLIYDNYINKTRTVEETISDLSGYLEDTKVKYYYEDFIYSNNYGTPFVDTDTISMDENFESKIAEEIKKNIRADHLPMCRLLPLNEENALKIRDMVDKLRKIGPCLTKDVARSHYAQIYRNIRGVINMPSAMKYLIGEEYNHVSNDLPVDKRNLFVFSEKEVKDCLKLGKSNIFDLLNYFSGGILNDLDLSHTFITGSAIPAVLHKYKYFPKLTMENSIRVYYPCIYTEFSKEDSLTLKSLIEHYWRITINEDCKTGFVICGNRKLPFTVKPGADLDLAIDPSVSDEQYERIADSHYRAIKKRYPSAQIVRIEKPNGGWNYSIYSSDPEFVPYFRQVEIYRSSFGQICTHHVAPVRGAFTSFFEGTPKLYLTASALKSYDTGMLGHYHYFAGKKSLPQDVLIKYKLRGFQTSSCDALIRHYLKKKELKVGDTPFINSIGMNFNVFAAQTELNFNPLTNAQRDLLRSYLCKIEVLAIAKKYNDDKLISQMEKEIKDITNRYINQF